MEALPASHALLNVSLNAIDLIFAFFLVLGGSDLTVSHPITGSVCLVLAPLLLFCSFAVWKESRWSFVAHAWLYWGAFGVLGVSVVVTTVAGCFALFRRLDHIPGSSYSSRCGGAFSGSIACRRM